MLHDRIDPLDLIKNPCKSATNSRTDKPWVEYSKRKATMIRALAVQLDMLTTINCARS